MGEAPGAEEDRCGLPFRGRSGRFLDEALGRVGLAREDVFITSSVKCRPPGNRDPRDEELRTCRAAWLDPQLELLDPEVVVTLGLVPARLLLGERRPLGRFHGRWRRHSGRLWLPTYHPAAAMRFPAARRGFRADLAKLAGWLASQDRPRAPRG